MRSVELQSAEATTKQPLTKGIGGTVLDEDAMLAASNFPIKPNDLVERAKEVLLVAGGGTVDPSVLDESFEFCAPVVGPLSRDEFLGALKSFDLLTAFPDTENNYHFFRVDPFEPNRVWFNGKQI